MSNLVETLIGSLDARSVQSMAQQLGLSPQATGNAIQAALPILMGQMAKNASQPDGAAALLGAVQRDHASINPGQLLGGLLGALGGSGASASAAGGLGDGLAILGHVFGGGSQRAATPQVPTVPGLDAAGSAKLMAMLAPLLMSVLGKMSQGGGLNASSLSGLLGGASQQISQAPAGAGGGLLGALLDQDGDGKVDIGDMLKAAQGLGSLFGKK